MAGEFAWKASRYDQGKLEKMYVHLACLNTNWIFETVFFLIQFSWVGPLAQDWFTKNVCTDSWVSSAKKLNKKKREISKMKDPKKAAQQASKSYRFDVLSLEGESKKCVCRL